MPDDRPLTPADPEDLPFSLAHALHYDGKRHFKRADGFMADAAEGFAANVLPIIERLQRDGIRTTRAIADQLNARRVSTARQGGTWHASAVGNLLRRQQAAAA